MTGRAVMVLLAGTLLTASCAGEGPGGTGGTAGTDRQASDRAKQQAPVSAATQAALPPCPAGARQTGGAPVPGGLPRLTLECLGPGPSVTLSALRGEPLVVNVWASWCPPCAQETPVLQQAHRRLGDRVRFLGVDLLDTREAAAAAADFGMGFPSVFDPEGRSRSALGVPGPPVTLFVRPDGTVAYRQVGEIENGRQLRGLLREHLGVGA